MAPGLDGQLDARGPGEVRRPGADRDGDDGGGDPPAIGVDAADRVTLDRDRADPAALDEPGPEPPGGGQEPGRGPRRVGIAGLRFVRPDRQAVRDGARDETGDLGRVDGLDRDPETLLHGDVRAHRRRERFRHRVQEPGPHEARVARPDVLRP